MTHRLVMHGLAAVIAAAACALPAGAASADEPAGQCSADPELNAQALIVTPAIDAATLRDRIATDPAYAARFGNPAITPLRLDNGPFINMTFGYPPLHDPAIELASVRAQPEIASVYPNGRVCLSAAPPDVVADVLEFRHATLDEYFYTADAGEIAAIDAGRVGSGWARTGERFRVVVAPGCPFAVDTPVYRFAAAPGAATGAHFFTRDRAECHAVDTSRRWEFEGVPFWASAPLPNGTCPAAAGRTPLLRVWRPYGASTHRFTTSTAVVEEMRAKGWIAEGAAMCVLAPPR